MSAEAQQLIARVRDEIGKKNFAGAQTLLDNAPTNRSDWTPQENDEVVCLVEFLSALKDASFT
jgi:hypothetical protein